MFKIRKRFLIAGVAAVVAAGTATGVYAAGLVSSGGGVAAGADQPNGSIAITNCKTTKVDFITNDTTGLGTSSTTYVDVPGMTKTISIAGSAPTCVVVHVASFSFAPGSGVLEFVRVTLDGSTCNPIETQFSAQDSTFAQAHAYLCAFANVAPGSHTVALQHRSNTGASVFLHRPSMSIEHK